MPVLRGKTFLIFHCIFAPSWAFTSSSSSSSYFSPSTSPSISEYVSARKRPHHIKQHTALNSVKQSFEEGSHNNDESSDNLPPLFVDKIKEESSRNIPSTTISNDAVVSSSSSTSLINSIERVRIRLIPAIDGDTDTLNNDDILRKIVQEGIKFQQTRQKLEAYDYGESEYILSYPTMERVPGCIATVHLQTSLIPFDSNDISTKKDPQQYRVIIQGSADAMLSGGLLALLSQTFSGAPPDGIDNTSTTTKQLITAADIMTLEPETLTTSMGLQSILSRGRNDGMASMVRVVQRQIQSLLGEGEGEQSSSSLEISPDGTIDTVDDEMLTRNASPAYIESNHDNSQNKQPTVAMLLSGGVDSSVALHLLLRQNYNVTAFYLRIWLEDELAHLGECPWEDDLQVCQAVCDHAGNVPLETVSLGTEYRERVIQYTIEEAQRGRTPNPDIMCNSRVKFGCFLEYIEESGMNFDYVASGHYARLEDDVVQIHATDNAIQQQKKDTSTTTRKRLFRAPDPVKDQSYFLCALTQQQLSKVLFPIGTYQKSEVRELANHFQLPNRNRPDSQGLCFLGKVKFDDFLSSYLGNRPGDVVDALNGEVIGRHNGLWYHTVGQRKGIGKVMFPLATARGPWYVVAKDQERDIVYVSNRYDEEDFAKARSEFEVEDVRWILDEAPVEAQEVDIDDSTRMSSWKEVRIDMKIRHGPRIVKGTLLLKDDGSTGNVRLENKDGGLAPGQYVVFYREGTDECLGAGIISERHWVSFLQNYQETVSGKTP